MQASTASRGCPSGRRAPARRAAERPRPYRPGGCPQGRRARAACGAARLPRCSAGLRRRPSFPARRPSSASPPARCAARPGHGRGRSASGECDGAGDPARRRPKALVMMGAHRIHAPQAALGGAAQEPSPEPPGLRRDGGATPGTSRRPSAWCSERWRSQAHSRPRCAAAAEASTVRGPSIHRIDGLPSHPVRTLGPRCVIRPIPAIRPRVIAVRMDRVSHPISRRGVPILTQSVGTGRERTEPSHACVAGGRSPRPRRRRPTAVPPMRGRWTPRRRDPSFGIRSQRHAAGAGCRQLDVRGSGRAG